MDRTAVWGTIHRERAALADLLGTLTPEEWEHPTLCPGWSVRDVAAHVIGIRPTHAKLSAFAVSSFYVGVAGALWGFVHLGSWEPLAFNINLSLNLLFMIIIGGVGTILGSFLGAGFILLLPIFLSVIFHALLGTSVDASVTSAVELIVFGVLIIVFLILEPHGLARLWQLTKDKLRLWPFPH